MIKIKDIMTKDLTYYDPGLEDKTKEYRKGKKYTYLPNLDLKSAYFLLKGKFTNKEIKESLKISPDLYIFDKDLLKKFEDEKHILFVFEQNLLVGIIHFSDYNRIEVYTYLYELCANLERDLRKLLVLEKLSNNDMLEFFKNHASRNDVYKEKFEKFKDYNDKFNKVGRFEFFDLSDLVALCDSKGIIRIDQKILTLRNKVMHSRSGVKIKNSEQDPLIYSFTSFVKFFNEAVKLHEEFRRIHNRVKIEMETI